MRGLTVYAIQQNTVNEKETNDSKIKLPLSEEEKWQKGRHQQI